MNNKNFGYKKLIGMQLNKAKKKAETRQEDTNKEEKKTTHTSSDIRNILDMPEKKKNSVNTTHGTNDNQNKDVEDVLYKLKLNMDGNVVISPSNGTIAGYLSKKENAAYFYKNKEWVFNVEYYDDILQLLSDNKYKYKRIPSGVINLCKRKVQEKEKKEIHVDYKLEGGIFDKLMPFQRKSVEFAISKDGRVLIADEMGLGKTVQALAIAYFYKKEWPVLIVSPASLLHTWKESAEKFLGVYAIILKDSADFGGDVSIVSYDMLNKFKDDLYATKYKVIVCDECHNIKSMQAQRTQAIMPFLQRAERTILMSGTPATSRPIELFPLFQALNKHLFPNYVEYGMRYCDGKMGFNKSYDFRGNSNVEELTYVLENEFMIRRTKDEVLKDLPTKTRKQINVEVKVQNSVQDSLKSIGGINKNGLVSNNSKVVTDDVMAAYRDAAVLKAEVVVEYVKKLIELDRKFLVFAHHAVMMDALEKCVQEMGVSYIRLDGKTTIKKRHKLVETFQNDEYFKVGVLSLTAASTGLTLTAANIVVFAELYWNPGIMMQAEDRVHRIGQLKDVESHYIVCSGTVDTIVWPFLIKKLNVLEKMGVGQNNYKNMGVGTNTGKTLKDYTKNK